MEGPDTKMADETGGLSPEQLEGQERPLWTESKTKPDRVKALLRCGYGKPDLAKRVVDFQTRYEEAMARERQARSEITRLRNESEARVGRAVAQERSRILRVLFSERQHREMALQRLERVQDSRAPKPTAIVCPVCKKQTVKQLSADQLECSSCLAVWWEPGR